MTSAGMRVASARSKAELSEHVCLCLKRSEAAYSVHSPPPCGEGLGVGVARLAQRRLPYAPPPSPTLPHKGGGSRLSSPLVLIISHERVLTDVAAHNFVLTRSRRARDRHRPRPCPSPPSRSARP